MSAPLRFVGGILALWVGARVALTWPGGDPLATGIVPAMRSSAQAAVPRTVAFPARPADAPRLRRAVSVRTATPVGRDPPLRPVLASSPAGLLQPPPSPAPDARPSVPSLPPLPPAPAAAPSPLRLDTYLFLRGSGGRGLAPGAQLGGAQIFARISRDLTSGLSVTVRVSRALRTADGEIAPGIAWQPSTALPVRITAERRIGVERGGRSAWAAFAAGGVSDVTLVAGVTLEGYAQAGIVGARRRDLFVDGAARIDTAAAGGRIGLGAWGAAQPGAARLDLGPQASWRVPLGRGVARLTVDGRLRVAGDARPGSGVAVTLATSL